MQLDVAAAAVDINSFPSVSDFTCIKDQVVNHMHLM